MNPYENIDAEDEQDQDDLSSEEDPDLVPFEDQDDLLDDQSFRDGKITNYGG